MDYDSITDATNTTQQSTNDAHGPSTHQNVIQNHANERVIPIRILTNPHMSVSSQMPSSMNESDIIDTVNNNNTYNNKDVNIKYNDNDKDGNLQRRSLLVTLEDGTTTQTLGSVRDIGPANICLDNSQNNNIGSVREIVHTGSTNQNHEHSPLIHR